MKWILTGLIVGMLLMVGCAQQAAPKDIVTEPAIKEDTTPDKEIPPTMKEDKTMPSEVIEEPVDAGVSQEELDKLAADIEGMEFDDVGGLSE